MKNIVNRSLKSNGEKIVDVAALIDNPSALTQEQGDRLFEEISKAIDSSQKIVVDFENIESIISPFLNNAFGQLYGKYSSDQIREHLVLRNFPETKNATMNIVIGNAKKFYENEAEFRQKAKDILDVE